MAVTAFAFHEPIFSFFEEVFETFTRFTSSETALQPIEEGIYYPSYLPEGYTKFNSVTQESFTQTIWVNEKERIILKQVIIDHRTFTLDTEENNYEIINSDNINIYCIEKNNVITLTWYNEKYSYTLWCTSGITRQEAIKIAQSLTVQSQ